MLNPLQVIRFTVRSPFHRINIEHIERLIESGNSKPRGTNQGRPYRKAYKAFLPISDISEQHV